MTVVVLNRGDDATEEADDGTVEAVMMFQMEAMDELRKIRFLLEAMSDEQVSEVSA